MKRLRNLLVVALLVAAVASAQLSGATNIARTVLLPNGYAKPNVIFALDDSGSMDTEIMINATDGSFWWQKSNGTGWDRAGVPNFNPIGTGDNNYARFGYLFPNGCNTQDPALAPSTAPRRHLCDSDEVFALAPTKEMAFLRSAEYNFLYYDHTQSYQPWPAATINGVSKSFPPSTPTAAPAFPGATEGLFDLTAERVTNLADPTQTNDFVFTVFKGMRIPEKVSREVSSGVFAPAASGGPDAAGKQRIAMSYFPATYWVKVPSCPGGATCTPAPDGSTLLEVQIRPDGRSFPSGRSYAEELQNFANWFTYYRTRRLMLASAMGSVLRDLTGMRLGVVPMNVKARATDFKITMYDTDVTDSTRNGQAAAGIFYSNLALSAPVPGHPSPKTSTPTRETVHFIGNEYTSDSNIIVASCQRNAAFVVSPGFANASAPSPAVPNYDSSTWGGNKAPYSQIYRQSLADISMYHYSRNLRPDLLPTGKVPAAIGSLDPAADKNTNLHMNTYGLTFGAGGTVWPEITDAYGRNISWPNPSQPQSMTAIDDLFHATLNSRGALFEAKGSAHTARQINAALKQILRLSGTQSGVTYSTVNLKSSDSTAYMGSYRTQGWSGDIEGFGVNPTNGVIGQAALWSANEKLVSKNWSTRLIATYNGSAGVAATSLGDAAMTKYLRGDRSLEGTTYRVRTGLLGAVINAEPVVSSADGVVYATSNEGMLHAFDKATGNELWAYVPSFGIADMIAQAERGSIFETILDATPVLAKTNSKTVLVGGRGTAGSGFYALDVSSPKSVTTEAALASRVLWEFPNSSTPSSIRDSVGVSMGRPLVVNTTSYGWVALVTSGYNAARDGKGKVFVLDAHTGALRATLATPAGPTTLDAGLSQVSGWLEETGKVSYVYAGDLQGNLWRFNLDSAGSAPLKIATLIGEDGETLPITTAPELTKIGERRLVLVGTGKLFYDGDFYDMRKQAFFVIHDNNTTVENIRSDLEPREVIFFSGTIRHMRGNEVDWDVKRGWYVDLPAGEKANTDSALAYSVIAFTTNQPAKEACASSSALYLAEVSTGKELPAANFVDGDQYFGLELFSTLASRATIARTSTGRVVVTSRQTDGTTNSRLLNLKGSVPAQKTGWREIQR